MGFIKDLFRKYSRLGLFVGLAAFLLISVVQFVLAIIFGYKGTYHLDEEGNVIYMDFMGTTFPYIIVGCILLFVIAFILLFTFINKFNIARKIFLITFFLDLCTMINNSALIIFSNFARNVRFSLLGVIFSAFYLIYALALFILLIVYLRTRKLGNLIEILFISNIVISVIIAIIGFATKTMFWGQHLMIYFDEIWAFCSFYMISAIMGMLLMFIIPSTMYCAYLTFVDNAPTYTEYSSSSYSDNDDF